MCLLVLSRREEPNLVVKTVSAAFQAAKIKTLFISKPDEVCVYVCLCTCVCLSVCECARTTSSCQVKRRSWVNALVVLYSEIVFIVLFSCVRGGFTSRLSGRGMPHRSSRRICSEPCVFLLVLLGVGCADLLDQREDGGGGIRGGDWLRDPADRFAESLLWHSFIQEVKTPFSACGIRSSSS